LITRTKGSHGLRHVGVALQSLEAFHGFEPPGGDPPQDHLAHAPPFDVPLHMTGPRLIKLLIALVVARDWRRRSDTPRVSAVDKTHQQNSGFLTVDNLMTFDGCVLFAIVESPREKGLIWTGSNDGQVQLTRDGGKTWTNVTANITGLPPWGTIANIEPSRFDAGTAYLSVDLHQVGNFDPYMYNAKRWMRIDAERPPPSEIDAYGHRLNGRLTAGGLLKAAQIFTVCAASRRDLRLPSGRPEG